MSGNYAKPREISRQRMLGELSDSEFAVINNMWGRGLKAIVDASYIEFHDRSKQPVAVIDRESHVAKIFPQQCGELEKSVEYGILGHEDKRTIYSVERC